jgi:hypothetical protein
MINPDSIRKALMAGKVYSEDNTLPIDDLISVIISELSNPDIISVAGVDYDGPRAVDLRRNVIELRNKALGPEAFDAQSAVILSHTIALLSALIERMWPEMAEELKVIS